MRLHIYKNIYISQIDKLCDTVLVLCTFFFNSKRNHLDWVLLISFPVSFCRQFNLRMKRDTSLFSDEFKVETSNKVLDYDTSHIYTGHIYGKLDLYQTFL